MFAFPLQNRRLHRWGAVLIAVPLLLTISTGVLLLLKKQASWIQPPTLEGHSKIPGLSFDQILAKARTVPAAGVSEWSDIDRLDVRPGKGIVKIRAKSRWEIQLDAATGEVLQAAYRRSDFIESLHDGSFFGKWMKLGVMLPSALVLLGMWGSGLYLFLLPYLVRWRTRVQGRAHAKEKVSA